MVEVGLSETGGGITGALCKAAWRVDRIRCSRLLHISAMHRLAARRCSGIFPQLFPRKTGSLATETPRLPGRSAVCLPPDCRRGPHSSQSGQCFPKPNKAAKARRPAATRALILLLPLVATSRHQFDKRDVRVVGHQFLGVGGDHAPTNARQARHPPRAASAASTPAGASEARIRSCMRMG